MILIIDYNVGNLYNLKNALDFQGLDNRIVTRPEELKGATHIILPGVGAFRPAMEHLRENGMDQAVREAVASGVPFLGVCVGMQLLFDESEEDGPSQGLGLIPGRIIRFTGQGSNGTRLKVPQMGWNKVNWQRDDPLQEGIPDGNYFYFVHSYHAEPEHPEDTLGLTDYGEVFPSVVRRGNVWGAQFHPEKSQNPGLRLLKNFSALRPQ
ncbi:MAG: imidazole glycerol phosphate synthase subunit HisH [Deltaproteobacteria bacterium]|nr:imidazole glycerol phosphate synthase subunit HisH [Deltaproteobacteria bacterium]